MKGVLWLETLAPSCGHLTFTTAGRKADQLGPMLFTVAALSVLINSQFITSSYLPQLQYADM